MHALFATHDSPFTWWLRSGAAALCLTLLLAVPAGLAAAPTPEAVLPVVSGVELQPLIAQVKRVTEALQSLGAPLSASERRALDTAYAMADQEQAGAEIQRILDTHCLAGIDINPEMRVKVTAGSAPKELVERGWRTFLVKVRNQAGATAELRVVSPNAQSVHNAGGRKTASDQYYRGRGSGLNAEQLWLDLETFNKQPLTRELSGLGLEYRVLSLYSRDAGQREAKLEFNVGQGTQDLGFRSEVDLLFQCAAAREVKLHVLDEHDQPTTATFIFRDHQGRVYPSLAKRLAPDFAFHPQIYRADGEAIRLPAGRYEVEFTRGPEYLTRSGSFEVSDPGPLGAPASRRPLEQTFKLERWIDPSTQGWWSGDHHIHAAGCAHYTVPTEGCWLQTCTGIAGAKI